MDALEFLKERNRMYESGAATPVIGLEDNYDPVITVKVVEEWSSAHPRKTRQSVFLEQWPNAWTYADGVLSICPNRVADWHRSTLGTCISGSKICEDCRREFWMQDVE